ncbi:MAG: hypothetical protein WBW73_06935 [Rhodoplanes sp.]
MTTYPSQNHHPFFFVPAYDRACQRLFFVSHRTGRPQVFFEELASGRLVQATDRDDLAEWSLSPALDGSAIYYVAGAGAYRLDLTTFEERQLADFGTADIRAEGMVGAAMGTTALSASARLLGDSGQDRCRYAFRDGRHGARHIGCVLGAR